jgi:hypothetical protein
MKRISIVFEEGPVVRGDVTFNVFLDGLSDARRKEIREMTQEQQETELSTGEFWAIRCYAIVLDAIARTGAVSHVHRRGDAS